jgi:hypothetical protein
MSVQLQASAAMPAGKEHCTHWMECWVGPRAGAYVFEKRKLHCYCQVSRLYPSEYSDYTTLEFWACSCSKHFQIFVVYLHHLSFGCDPNTHCKIPKHYLYYMHSVKMTDERQWVHFAASLCETFIWVILVCTISKLQIYHTFKFFK